MGRVHYSQVISDSLKIEKLSKGTPKHMASDFTVSISWLLGFTLVRTSYLQMDVRSAVGHFGRALDCGSKGCKFRDSPVTVLCPWARHFISSVLSNGSTQEDRKSSKYE